MSVKESTTKVSDRSVEKKNYYESNKAKIKRRAQKYYYDNKDHVKLLKIKHRDKDRNRRLLNQYGITLEKYRELKSEQSGRCSICKRIPDKELFVDHCHTTGAVRGLLCTKCNVSIGGFEDNLIFMESAIKYLQKYMSEKLTVTRVYNDKITTAKYGVKDKISIYTEEYPETKMSSLDKSAQGIKVGDKIEVSIEKNGSFTNFKMPRDTSGATRNYPAPSSIPAQVEIRLKRLEDAVFSGVEPANVLAEDEPVF